MWTEDEAEIRDLVIRWIQAVAASDRKAILTHHDQVLLMYDFPAPVRGLDAFDATWQFFDDSRT